MVHCSKRLREVPCVLMNMGTVQGAFSFIVLLLLSSRCQQQQPLLRVPLTEEVQGVCSTWGIHNILTFDGNMYRFPGTCSYVFASHCKVTYSEFEIQIRRTVTNKDILFAFTAIIDGVVLEGKYSELTLDGKEVWRSMAKGSIIIEDICTHFRIKSGIGLTLTWNKADDLQLSLPERYMGRTCGLCANFDGNKYNDFEWEGYNISQILYGNLQRLNLPEEDCSGVPEDANAPISALQCRRERELCETILQSFEDCESLVPNDDYIQTCIRDLCVSTSWKAKHFSAICSTLDQYTRECVRAGGDPGHWRKPGRCSKNCSFNMEFLDCGSPCSNTCSNPDKSQLCEEPCSEGCFCPPGTVLDNIRNIGCIPADECPCVHRGKVYVPGEAYSSDCENCTCIGSQWSCAAKPCAGKCSFRGGSHMATFDGKAYLFHGDCKYLFAKDNSLTFIIVGEIEQCGTTKTVSCLKNIYITIKTTLIKICDCGTLYINKAIQKMPYVRDDVTITRPSSSYVEVFLTDIDVHIQVQIEPAFQVFITVASLFRGNTSGLCGNFNSMSSDDFQTASGVVEDSAYAFANSWKTMSACFDVQDNFEDPCWRSSDQGNYATRWCQHLTNKSGVFAPCHQFVEPDPYFKNCLYDTCSSETTEKALCAAFSTYAWDCLKAGMQIVGWRNGICEMNCPESMVFSYSLSACNSSCRLLVYPNTLCDLPTIPVEGCGCPPGTFLNDDDGQCVELEKCPCFHDNDVIPAESSFSIGPVLCKCIQGVLDCPSGSRSNVEHDCTEPMYYVDCLSGSPNESGAECQKSCKTQDMHCYTAECVSGCRCPEGLLSDDNGGCIPEDQCPCVYGESLYSSGQVLTILCNNCICRNRTWTCTGNVCPMTCNVYGNGHYTSYDGARFNFRSECDYTLTQDFCLNNPENGTFRIIVKNIACGAGEAICSLSIMVVLQDTVIVLSDGVVKEKNKDSTAKDSYKVNLIGMYIIVKTYHGLTLIWDQKTTVAVQLKAIFQGKVCGMCGNFDSQVSNDFTSRFQSLETSEEAFGDSWKVHSYCPVSVNVDPCYKNPFREAWAQKHCSIIKSDIFVPCHSKVSPVHYFEACVSDTCACDTGGDCQCLCTAIAAYATNCRGVGICIDWRSPRVCPVFCDFYNDDGQCMWHYKPCGDPCLRTCKNPEGKCENHTNSPEGCYPQCSLEKPYYDEDQLKCAAALNCSSCTPGELLCTENLTDCLCCYEGRIYKMHEDVYNITDGLSCMTGICGPGGVINHASVPCGTLPTSLPFVTETATSEATAAMESATSRTSTLVNAITSSAMQRRSKAMFHARMKKPEPTIQQTSSSPFTSEAFPKYTVSTTFEMSTSPVISVTNELKSLPTEQKTIGTWAELDCYIVNSTEIINHNNCTSKSPISVPFCKGHCGTSAIYSHEAGTMTHKCSCCRETKTRNVDINLLCSNGSDINYTYVYVEECACTQTECRAASPPFL